MPQIIHITPIWTRHTCQESIRIIKNTRGDDLEDNLNYVEQEKDAKNYLGSIPHRVDT